MMEQLLPGFVDESKEIVERVTEHLIELEKARDEPRFDDLARGLHTLKGSAATLGLIELAELAHRMEDAVLPLRKKPVALPGALTDALLATLDVWMQHLRATAAKAELPDLTRSKELLVSVRHAVELVDSGKRAKNTPARPKRARRERAGGAEEDPVAASTGANASPNDACWTHCAARSGTCARSPGSSRAFPWWAARCRSTAASSKRCVHRSSRSCAMPSTMASSRPRCVNDAASTAKGSSSCAPSSRATC